MASPWSYAYDHANCPSGIFYVNDPRENVVYEMDHVNHGGPRLNGPNGRSLVAAATMPFSTVQHHQMEGTFPAPPLPQRQPDRIYLPALRVSANVFIKAMVAETVVTQSFQNLNNTPIERASYSFPLYEGSVVHRFKCFVGKRRVIEGVVEPKQKAKAEFEKAVARQRVAAILEEHTPEIFETHIGSIPANEIIRVEVSYISELKVDLLSKDVIFVLPMSIASRYGTPPDSYSEGNSTIEEQGLEINVDVSFPVPITSLASRSHPISVTIGSTAPTSLRDMNTEIDLRKANATLSNRSAELKGDFILLISPKESISNTKAFLEPHPKYDDHSAIMVTISPQDFARNASSTDYSKCEILFVIDCSGSMEDKVNDLRTAMKVAIRSLPEGCFFNLCLFGSSHELLWGASKPSTQKNSDEAFACSAQLMANKGATELNSALQSVITSRTPDMQTNVIVVTDGETWDTNEIHASVEKANKECGIRFFCLGIGNAVSHALVEGIGRQGGGLSEVVALADSGKWEPRVIRLLKGALTPASWQITLNPGRSLANAGNRYSTLGQADSVLPSLRAPPCIQAPFRIPKLHTFSRFSVFLLVNNSVFEDSGSKIHITAESSSGETVNLAVTSEKLESTPSAVHFLAAHAAVKDLENQTSWLHGMQNVGYHGAEDIRFQDIVKNEAESFGKTWSIVGKWTSFIVLEKSGLNAHVKNLVHLYRAEALSLPSASVAESFSVRRRSCRGEKPITGMSELQARLASAYPSGAHQQRDRRRRARAVDRSATVQRPPLESQRVPESAIQLPELTTSIQQDIRDLGHSSLMPRQSTKESVMNPPASGISVEDIVSAQRSSGCFVLHSASLNTLLSAFDEKAVQQAKSRVENKSSDTKEPLLPTILTIVYIEMQFQEQQELLELVIDRAKRWLEKALPEEIDELLEVVRGGFLGNGVESAGQRAWRKYRALRVIRKMFRRKNN